MSDPTSTKTQSDTEQLLARAALYQLLAASLRHPRSSNVRIDLEKNSQIWYSAVEILETHNRISRLTPSPSPLPLKGGEDKGEGVVPLSVLSAAGRAGLKQSLSLLLKDIRKTGDQEWIRQYENCFGHTAHAKVPAYELEYGEEHSHREPRELADITAFYEAFGLQSAPSAHERADHVSVECEFMHFLLYKQACAESLGEDDHASVCQDGSRSFLEHHLGRWLPALASRLSRHASGDLIKQIADFALAFILVDCETQGLKAGRRDLPVRVIDEKREAECVSCQYGPTALSSRQG